MKFASFRSLAAAGCTIAMLSAAGPALAKGSPEHLPANFVKVADALKNPGMAFIPGLGTLYVDPKTLPAGPFFGYDKKGKLVNVNYMLPMTEINAHKSWDNVGLSAHGLKFDHTDVYTSGAHPGVPEVHLHIVNWLIPVKEEAALGKYAGMVM